MHLDNSNSYKDFIRIHLGKPLGSFFSLKHLMTCLCLGTLGLNTLNKAWGDYQTSSVNPMINAYPQGKGGDTHPESYESYQLRILRNQNHLQTEKIKTLREEMHEITQKLHELKPHLFKHGDPADQAKIAQLTVLLGEKEETLNELTTIKEQLNRDLSIAKKKLIEMEIIKEALATMVDSHREAKERNSADFQKQLGEIQLAAEQEKTELQRKIQQHEAIQEKLNQQLTAKAQTINRLDDLTTKMNSSLAAKNEELLQLEGHILSLYDIILHTSEHHVASRQALEQQIQELIIALDWEKTKSIELGIYRDETQWLSDILNGTQATLLNEIDQLKEALAVERAKGEDLLGQHSQHKSYLKQNREQIQKLVLLIEFEQTRSQKLENELLTLLNQQEADNHHLDAVEVQLDEIKSRLASKHAELQNATAEFTLNLAALLSHLESAESSADQTKKELEALTSKYNDTFGTLIFHLDQHDQELNGAREEHVQGIGTLLSHLDQSEQFSHKFLNDYLDTKDKLDLSLIKQKQHEETLQKSLEEAYEAYKLENYRLTELEEFLKETMHNSKLAQIDLISKNVVIASQVKSLDDHQKALLGSQVESIANKVLTQALNQMALNHDFLALRNEELEFQAERLHEEVVNNYQRLSMLENKLATLEHDNREVSQEILFLQEQLNHRNIALNESKAEIDHLNFLVGKMGFDIEQAEQKLANLSEVENLLHQHRDKLAERDDHIFAITQHHEHQRKEFDDFRLEQQKQIEDTLSKLSIEEARNKSLLDDLNFAQENYNRERSNLLNLEKIYQDNQNKLTQLQRQNEQHEISLKNALQQVENLTQSKTQIKKSLSTIYQKTIQELEVALGYRSQVEEGINTQIDETFRNLELSEENQKLKQENEHLERKLSQYQKIAEEEHSRFN